MTLPQNVDSPRPPDDELVQYVAGSSPLFKAIVDGATDAIFIKDRDGRFLLFNRAAAQFVGRPVEGVLGKKAVDLFGEEAGESIRKLELEVMETGVASTAEQTIDRAGTISNFLTTRSPYRDEHGKIIGLIGIARDITEKKRVESELQQSQLRWRFALESTGDGIWDWDMKTGKVYYSRQWKAMLGYSKEEIGDTAAEWFDRLPPDDLALCQEAIGNHLQGKTEDFVLEHRMLAKDGSLRWILARGKVVERAEDGAALRIIGTNTDITQRKTAEHELYLERERLGLAAEALHLGVWDYNFAANTILCDARWYEIYGVDPTSVVTMETFNARLHPDDVERVAQERLTTLERRERIHRMEFRIITPAGETRRILSAARMLEADERTPNRFVGIVMDITESRQAEETLKNSYEALRQAEKLAKVGSWTLDLKTSRFTSSGMLNEMNGLGPDDPPLTPDRLRDLLPPEGFEKVRNGIERCIADGTPYEVETEHRRIDGTSYFAHIRGQANLDASGKTISVTGTVQDITEVRQAAEILEQARDAAEAAEHAKSDFLAMMSHEIRTPMNTVLGMTRLALQTDLAPRQRNYLDKIHTAANTLISIINDVLDFSKIEAGKLDIEETEFTLESVLESTASVTALKAEEKGLEIVYEVAPDVPERLVGDSLRLGQILINLVSNAVKFTERGEVVVSIDRVPQGKTNAATLHFAVRDTGIGLDSDQLAGLFRAFSQADRDTSRKYGGTGLGLAICKQLVERMGGGIWATSEPGKGSTFFFTIEVRLPAVHDAHHMTPKGANLKGRRVLIADDNPSARDILSQMVRNFGLDVEAVDSGESALATLKLASSQHQPFELVLMDWRMPGMDGLDAAQRIKADMNLREIPAVLMVTAYGREEVLRMSEHLGLQGVLIKPVTESVMFNTITDILEPAFRESATFGPHSEASSRLESQPPSQQKWIEQLNHRRVLVVDDNALNREVVSDFLMLAGVDVGTASNGIEALKQLKDGDYEAVLMDVHMPVVDGLTAVREIRKEDRWSKLPIVALTAQARLEDREASLAAGMNAHLTKPIDEMELYRTLLQLLPLIPVSINDEYSSGQSDGEDAENSEVGGDLTSLDLSAALARLGNNPERLSRLLQGFVRDFNAAPAQLVADHLGGHLEGVASLAHAVRGAASYLDAHDLCTSADELEQAARKLDHDTVNKQAPIFRHHLEALLRKVNYLISPVASEVSTTNAVDIPMVLNLATTVEPLVASGDYAAQSLLEQIGIHLSGTTAAALAEAILVHFDELELEEAIVALQRLRNDLEKHSMGGVVSL
jgi:two-component system, sensor histidine kinase and response regulator